MLMPGVFGENMFDNWFSGMESMLGSADLMKTDVKDTEQGYDIIMNLPGVKKEDVKAELKNGYLTITASTSSDRNEEDQEGRYIRRERYTGSGTRSFYVGDGVKEEDISARFEDGTLKLQIPKKRQEPVVEQKRYIAIEG